MKTKQRIAVQYFLSTLEKKMLEDRVAWINPVWTILFGKEELQDIVKWLHPQKLPDGIKLEEMDEEQLLDEIGDEYLILSYLIEQMDKELKAYDNPTDESVNAILKQLRMETHYLAFKPIAQWDEFDMANYKAMSVVTGYPIPMYGVFRGKIKDEEKYLAGPIIKLHYLKSDADTEIEFHREEYDEIDVKIMIL